MDLKIDEDKFEEYQTVLTEALIQGIRVKLLEAGLKDRALEEATAEIAFSITSIIDDTTMIENESGESVRPYLTFLDDDNLLHYGENSFTYERVKPMLKKIFDV